MEFREKAYAKVNWTLEVHERFGENHPNAGYTNITTALFLIDLADSVSVKRIADGSGEIEIVCDVDAVPQTENGNAEQNVCFRAVKALRNSCPTRLPDDRLQINIEKNIPLAGGLGGSSTDGVAVIRALNQLYGLSLSLDQQTRVAAEFGSDTVFFASGYRAAVATGRGEVLEELPVLSSPVWLVLVNPGVEMHVSDVYKSYFEGKPESKSEAAQTRKLEQMLNAGAQADELCMTLKNDLAESKLIQDLYPDISVVTNLFKEVGCLEAAMSGSGSTVFGVVRDEHHARVVSEAIAARLPNYQIFSAPLLR